jgi:Integrase core domain
VLSSEQTSTQAQLLFARALDDQDLLDSGGLPPSADDGLPVLVAWSDNGSEMTATDTRQFIALLAITQHHGRPGTPTDQAHIESFFNHLKGDWPHLTEIRDPAALDAELARIRVDYNTRRLHAAIGYVTPDDEHHGRGPAIRRARAAGMRRARGERIKQNRALGCCCWGKLAFSTLIVTRWSKPWFTISLGIVVGVMMVCYVAVPSRLTGAKPPKQSKRDKLATTAVGGALSVTVCTPPYVLGRVGILMLGSSGVIIFIAGIFLVAFGVTLQAGATGAVRAIKMSATLAAAPRPADASASSS